MSSTKPSTPRPRGFGVHQNENPGPKRIANVGRVIVARRNVWPIVEGLDVRDSRFHQLNGLMLVRAPALVN